MAIGHYERIIWKWKTSRGDFMGLFTNKSIDFDNSKIINDFNWNRSAMKYLEIFKKLW